MHLLHPRVAARETPPPRPRCRSARASAPPASSTPAAPASSRTGREPRPARSAESAAARPARRRRDRERRRPRRSGRRGTWWSSAATMSAPSSSGRCRYGDAKVLSTTSSAPARVRRPRRAAAMSTTFSSGLVGVSIHTSRVSASRCAARSVLQFGVEIRRTHAPRLVDLREQAVGPAVHVVHGHHAVAGPDQVHDGGRRPPSRMQTRSRGRSPRGLPDTPQRAPGGVGGARVVVALVPPTASWA